MTLVARLPFDTRIASWRHFAAPSDGCRPVSANTNRVIQNQVTDRAKTNRAKTSQANQARTTRAEGAQPLIARTISSVTASGSSSGSMCPLSGRVTNRAPGMVATISSDFSGSVSVSLLPTMTVVGS